MLYIHYIYIYIYILYIYKNFVHILFYLSNLAAKTPGLNLHKKLRKLLINHGTLNQQAISCIFHPLPKQTCMYCNAMTSFYTTAKQYSKKWFLYSNIRINTINTKKLCFSYQIASEKAFCLSQISMISIKKILVTFEFASNLLRNLTPETVLQLEQPKV